MLELSEGRLAQFKQLEQTRRRNFRSLARSTNVFLAE